MIKKYLPVITLTLLAFFIGFASYFFNFTKIWQDKIFDLYFIKKEVPNNILIISIDNQTLSDLGGWPLQRKFYAKIVDNMQLASAIGFDVAFVDKSFFGYNDDLLFRNQLSKNINAKVILPLEYDDRGLKEIEPIFKDLTEKSFVNVLVDSDGVVRRFNPTKGNVKSFGLSLLNKENIYPKELKIDYFGKAKSFPHIPFVDVYNGKLPQEFFKNKIVLVGATSPDLHDFFQTPFGIISGVEIHSNIISTLQNGKFFKNIHIILIVILLLFVSFLPFILITRIKKIGLLIFSFIFVFCSISILSIFLFSQYILLPNLPLSISFVFSFGSMIVFQYIKESKEKKFIREMFQYYLTPDVINQLIKNPEKLSLGGEKKEITIFFSDIRGFTSISEQISAENLTLILNEYLTEMTDVIMQKKGLVDKYIGDAVMAFWGAPVENQTQVEDACTAMILMSEKLKMLNEKWIKEGRNIPTLSIGMGLNFGNVVVGNMGSKTRFNYTVMGDEVNFASRLEGLNKAYATECLISQSVYEKIKDNKEFTVRFIDEVIVKGKKEPKMIFELIVDTKKENLNDLLSNFDIARNFYQKGDFKEAKNIFSDLVSTYNDGASKTFFERCQNLEKNPPENWTGIYEFKDK